MNHRTTTVPVAIVVVAATLLAAGTVASLGSDNFALAYKKYNKAESASAYHKKDYMRTKDNDISQVPYKQIIICIITGPYSSIQSGACTNTINIRNPSDLGISPTSSMKTSTVNPTAVPTKSTNLDSSYPAATAPTNTREFASVEFPFG
jgi:hypothetical protein